jgi:hypothetical protein
MKYQYRMFDHSEEKNIPLAKNEKILNNYNSEDLKNYSTNGDIKAVDFYDFEEHSMKIFSTMNKLRRHPEKFIKKLYYLISKLDTETHIADLTSKYHANVSFPVISDPMDAIAFLEKVSPKDSLMWSIKYNIRAFEELENSVNQTEDNLIKTELLHDTIIKIKTNFVLDPMLTVLIIFLISEENRKLIFSDDYSMATVATVSKEDGKILDSYSEFGHTLIYFVKSENH